MSESSLTRTFEVLRGRGRTALIPYLTAGFPDLRASEEALGAADELADTADQLTQTLAGMAPLALLGMKKHLTRIARGVLDTADLQRDIASAAQSADLKEGATAWAEKRAARFTGR